MKSINSKFKIKSSYVIKNILNYIPDTNFHLKLFIYSKLLQKKLNIELIDYKEKYIKKIGFDISKYLILRNDIGLEDREVFLEEYNNFILKKNLNKKQFESIIYDVYKNKNIEDIIEDITNEDSKVYINMESPLFEILSNTKICINKYPMYISQQNIDKYNLKDKYILFYNNLNKTNINYSSILFSFSERTKIKYLKEFNIDFNKITKLILKERFFLFDKIEQVLIKTKEERIKGNECLFENLFSFNNIENNLVYLKIDFYHNFIINPNLFEKINKFKALKYLCLKKISKLN